MSRFDFNISSDIEKEMQFMERYPTEQINSRKVAFSEAMAIWREIVESNAPIGQPKKAYDDRRYYEGKLKESVDLDVDKDKASVEGTVSIGNRGAFYFRYLIEAGYMPWMGEERAIELIDEALRNGVVPDEF